MIKTAFFLLSTLLLVGGCTSPEATRPADHTTQVLVIGGGCGGVGAAIQAARSGAQVILVEESPWLGGMLTAAGVAATDGNHFLPSGLWGEFRQKLYDHYGGPKALSTGWVSFTLFEPKVGEAIWSELAHAEPLLEIMHGYRPIDVIKKGNRVEGVVLLGEEKDTLRIEASQTIDATELGDVLAYAGAAYFTGMDTEEEPHNVNIQDLTYAAIVKKYPPGQAPKVYPSTDYDPLEFACLCETVCPDTSRQSPPCDQMLEYAHLPNGKYMLNWPNDGNDYFVNVLDMSHEERLKAYERAKERTMDFLYFLQTEAGFPDLGLVTDEFPTEDHLPIIPYHREGRRLKGRVQLEVEDLEDPYLRNLYAQAIAVGDYPLDHHHDKNPAVIRETFPAIPSFSIPYASLIPEQVDGLIVAEKGISVSHVVNGATRLQPCVILTGQAAGAAAALCIRDHIDPGVLQVRALQQELLAAGCWLLPFFDTKPTDWYFESVQKAGLSGIFKGNGVPYQWANQTWFYPDSSLTRGELETALALARNQTVSPRPESAGAPPISRGESVLLIWKMLGEPQTTAIEGPYADIPSTDALFAPLNYFVERGWTKHWANGKTFRPLEALTRKEAAWLIESIYAPFLRKPVPPPAPLPGSESEKNEADS